jgi:glycosyltransferase involved in cell wall biosynthesis
LRGTGSNVYNANLGAALVALGHEVHLIAQDLTPEELPAVDAVGTWDSGSLQVRQLRKRVRLTVYRPKLSGVLPVLVADRFETVRTRPFVDLNEREIDEYLLANVEAVREIALGVRPDFALANHLVMGPAILARALVPLGTPYVAKIHGTALEYVVKRDPRFVPWARLGLRHARAVLVGSRHTAERLWRSVDEPGLRKKTRLGAPGVDISAFCPRPPAASKMAMRRLSAALTAQATVPSGGSVFDRDTRIAGAAVRQFAEGDGPRVVYVGKLSVTKGVDLLLAAWPLVLQRIPTARLAVVGFGNYRSALEDLASALTRGNLGLAREIAVDGPAREGRPRHALRYLTAFLDWVESDAQGRDAYFHASARLEQRLSWVGRLEHSELTRLLPACDAQVVPSTFPEAFGMVVAEAAACGVFPVSAGHSGLAEVTASLDKAVPDPVRQWLSFPLGPEVVHAIADRLVAYLSESVELRAAVSEALAGEAARLFGWDEVARGLVVAGCGRIDTLPPAA